MLTFESCLVSGQLFLLRLHQRFQFSRRLLHVDGWSPRLQIHLRPQKQQLSLWLTQIQLVGEKTNRFNVCWSNVCMFVVMFYYFVFCSLENVSHSQCNVKGKQLSSSMAFVPLSTISKQVSIAFSMGCRRFERVSDTLQSQFSMLTLESQS